MFLGSLLGAAFGLGALLVMFNLDIDLIRQIYARLARLLNVDPTVLGWVVVGATSGGFLLSILKGTSGGLIGCVVGGVVAGFTHHSQMTSTSKKLEIQQSLVTPAFLDMLSISMSTGAGLRTAFSSLLTRSDPILQDLWRPVIDDSDDGLVERLQKVVLTAQHSPTQRIANALIVSTERGTPIVDVLQSLAQEIRAESRRQLLEIAAKKDVQMMLPVVFGVLPSITAIALFPAVGSLTALS